jgi:hypothetical protein
MIVTLVIEEESLLRILAPVDDGDVERIAVGECARQRDDDARVRPLERELPVIRFSPQKTFASRSKVKLTR